MRYAQHLLARIAAIRSPLCVGLDPRPDLLREPMDDFLRRVVEETAPYAAAFKPNLAYFEALGSKGLASLERLMEWRPKDVPFILDGKRGDIPETMKYYAQACYDAWGADAVTLHAYMGFDPLAPFLDRPGRGVYLLAVTSNPGAADVALQPSASGQVFEHVTAMHARAAGRPADVGFVAGLTNVSPDVLARIPDAPLLVPGLGAQGGQVSALDAARRKAPILINASRSILYDAPEKSFAEKARAAVESILSSLPIPTPTTP